MAINSFMFYLYPSISLVTTSFEYFKIILGLFKATNYDKLDRILFRHGGPVFT